MQTLLCCPRGRSGEQEPGATSFTCYNIWLNISPSSSSTVNWTNNLEKATSYQPPIQTTWMHDHQRQCYIRTQLLTQLLEILYPQYNIHTLTNPQNYRTSQTFICILTSLLITSVLPPSSKVSHSRVFRADYGCVEKTLLPLIIKHWECAN